MAVQRGSRYRYQDITFTDRRCEELWARNDLEMLRKVREVFPDILSQAELDAAEDYYAFLRSDQAYREFYDMISQTEPSLKNEERLAWEYEGSRGGPRWQIVCQLLDQQVDYRPERILDLGAWTGVSGIDLSNRYPMATVFLREIGSGCLRPMQWMVEHYAHQPDQIVIELGDHLEPPLPTELDLVFIGEALEHVRDVDQFIQVIEAACKPGAIVILSTPVEIPIYKFVKDPIHVRNMTADDLKNRFGDRLNFFCYRAPGNHVFGWQVSAEFRPVRDVDWGRKFFEFGFLEDAARAAADARDQAWEAAVQDAPEETHAEAVPEQTAEL